MYNQYYTWSDINDEVSHTGILTVETLTHNTLLTKYGEMTICKDDGIFTEATRADFEACDVPDVQQPLIANVTVNKKLGSRTAQAFNIIDAMPDATKEELLAALQKQMNITKSNASIYYAKIIIAI